MAAMMILIRNRLTRLLVVLVMALAMTSSAFAHRLPGGDDAALETFILLGGNLNDLCGEGHDGPGGSCPLCRIADDPSLPDQPEILLVAQLGQVSERTLPVADLPLPAQVRGLPAARGPPSL